jgi:multidrug resistance efflux pump
VTAPETVINYLALVVMATSGIKTLFNLNPLIKLDGYYLLSDYLEIPNLRQRASSYLTATIQRVRGLGLRIEATRRERRIYLTYGLLSGIYSFSLLGFIALGFGSYLIERYQGFGFLLFTGLAMTMFRNPLKKALPKFPALFGSSQGRFMPMKRLIKIFLLLATLAVLIFVKMELKVSGEFTVLPVHNADVRAEVEGIIAEIYVEEGDRVSAGDPIARLSDWDYRAELTKIEAAIAEQQAQLRLLQVGPRKEEIEVARTEVEKAKERLKYARETLDTFRDLLQEKAISRLRLQEAEEQVAVRGKELEAVEGRLNILLAGSRPEEIEATEAAIARSEAQRRYLDEQLRRARVVSPIAGVVTTPKLRGKTGQHVEQGDLIAEVHELKTVTAEIPISEKEIADVDVGHQVLLKARAYPDQSFYGKVTSIAPTAATRDEWQAVKTILVTTEIENASLVLKPEMTGNAKILCGKRRIVSGSSFGPGGKRKAPHRTPLG